MESSGVAEQVRNEDGNEKYEYFIPLHDEETILLIDSWRDQKAIDFHHATPMMEKINELRNKYDLHMKVERFTCDDEDASEDNRFIRK